MARTRLLQCVEDAVGSVAAERGRGLTRQELVKRAAIAGAGLSALGRFAPVARAAGAPRIVVVGAGLAGLTCTYRLKQAGVNAMLYEASNRIGAAAGRAEGSSPTGRSTSMAAS